MKRKRFNILSVLISFAILFYTGCTDTQKTFAKQNKTPENINQSTESKEEYKKSVIKKIKSNSGYFLYKGQSKYQQYPIITFRVNRLGKASYYRISQSSGSKELDKIAQKTVEISNPFRAFPSEIKEDEIEISCDFNSFMSMIYKNELEENQNKQNVQEKQNSQEIDKKCREHNAKVDPNGDFAPYMRNIQRKVKYYWEPIKTNNIYSTILLFSINKDGSLKNVKVYKSSGCEEYDDRAIEAVQKAAPFEKLPENYKGQYVDVQFNFDYNVFGTRSKQ